jgi:hypothetical protein
MMLLTGSAAGTVSTIPAPTEDAMSSEAANSSLIVCPNLLFPSHIPT